MAKRLWISLEDIKVKDIPWGEHVWLYHSLAKRVEYGTPREVTNNCIIVWEVFGKYCLEAHSKDITHFARVIDKPEPPE